MQEIEYNILFILLMRKLLYVHKFFSDPEQSRNKIPITETKKIKTLLMRKLRIYNKRCIRS